VVLTCTVRALKHHGGLSEQTGSDAARAAAEIVRGSENLRRHIEIVREFGIPCVVAVNRRPEDSDDEVELTRKLALEHGAHAAEISDGFARGGEGAAELAQAVVDACELASDFRWLYEDHDSLAAKIDAVAKRIYGAADVYILPEAEAKLHKFESDGLGQLPVCMAKTHLSLSADPELLGAPEGFTLPVRDVRAYTGAGWVVPLCGNVMQMPGLGKEPAAVNVDLTESGRTIGLF
jgi:formyltetrahydrofolate synthetase